MHVPKCKTIQVSPQIDLTDIRKFVREVVLPRAKSNDEQALFDKDTTEKLYKLGLLTCITPREFGGPDLPVSDLIWVTRELAYGSAGVTATFIGNLLGYSALVLHGSDELKAKVCKEFTSRPGLWSFAMTEKGCGSDLQKTATQARKVKGGYVINGEKNFITNANHSTKLAVFANVIDENGMPQGISCFYVPGDSQGLERGEPAQKLGWRESNTGHLFFKDVFVPEEHLLGQINQGLQILTHCLNRSKTLLAATSVGLALRGLDLAQERLLSTKRYGRALIDQSAIRHLLARLHTKTEAAWLLACSAAAVWDAGLPAVREASMAKLFAGSIGVEVTSQTLELFGARGFLSEFEVSRLYRDAKAIEIVEGPTLVQELLIAKQVLPRIEDKPKADVFSIDSWKFEKSEKKGAA